MLGHIFAGLLCGVSLAGAALVQDLDGHSVDTSRLIGDRVAVFVFVRTDCPISNRYAPELNRLHSAFTGRGVGLWLVYPDANESAAAIRKHLAEYGYRWRALRDPHHELVKLARVNTTPEAAVFSSGKQVYRGRIDDRYTDFGKARPQPSTHDLEAAVEAALAGKPAPAAVTRAVGCFISDLR